MRSRLPALLLVLPLLGSSPAALPLITTFYAAQSPVPTEGSTTLTAAASGPAGISWSATGGTILGSGSTVTWQAPGSAGTYTVSVQVSDGVTTESSSVDLVAVAGLSVWTSTPPADCPFPTSDLFSGLAFTGGFASQHFCDTWYPSWGADGNLYSPWMDGILLTPGFTQDVIGDANAVYDPSRTGWAKLAGDSPTNLEVVDAGLISCPRQPYGGRYASASLHVDGVWYYGTYSTTNVGGSNDGFVTINGVDYNWGVCGPLVGFHTSTDGGHTWTAPAQTPSSPLFGEPSSFGGTIKFAAPHFVDFGQNMQHSPDGKAYLVAHGAVDPDPSPRLANVSWITGDQIYLARVTPSPSTINDPSAWEFYGGPDGSGVPTWTSSLAQARPIIDWNNNCGGVTLTWFPALGRYLACIVDGRTTADTMNTYILESPTLTGPFRLVTYLTSFGEQGYFVNFPSKFIASDGQSAWMWYSANFHPLDRTSNPPGSGYHLCSREVRFLRRVYGAGFGPDPLGIGASSSSGSSGSRHCTGSVVPASFPALALGLAALLLVRSRRKGRR